MSSSSIPRFEYKLEFPRWPEHSASLPPVPTFENFQPDLDKIAARWSKNPPCRLTPPALENFRPDLDKLAARWRETPPLRVTPPENPQDERVIVALYACFFGALSVPFIASILTRTSFESKTKTAISLAGGATVAILFYTNPLIGFVAFAILGVLAGTLGKKPSSSDALLKLLTSDDRRILSPLEAAMERSLDALSQQRREEQLRQHVLQMYPIVRPPVIHPFVQMPPPRFVLPPLFFDPFRSVKDLQPRNVAGG